MNLPRTSCKQSNIHGGGVTRRTSAAIRFINDSKLLVSILLLPTMFDPNPYFLWFDGTIIVYYYYPLKICTTVSNVLLCSVALHGD